MTDPDDTTPLDPDEADDLLPSHITVRSELNAWEQANIVECLRWVEMRRFSPATVLTPAFARELHRRMFNRTWAWAGCFRKSLKNIGVAPEQISSELQILLANAGYWIEHRTYPTDEIAVRFHRGVVWIHPFPNGNGRHGRLLTDVLLRSLDASPFSWGSGALAHAGAERARYLAALKAADNGEYLALLTFVRG